MERNYKKMKTWKKNALMICAASLIGSPLFGQSLTKADADSAATKMAKPEQVDTLWKITGGVGLNMSQVYLKNWSAGGQSSVSGTVFANLSPDYNKGKSSWDNEINLAYGMLHEASVGRVVKTDDKIDISSKYGHQSSEHWYLTALLNFKSQFAPGYVDPRAAREELVLTSDFMSPAYALAAVGMDYKPSDKFSAFLSPITSKNTIVLDQTLADFGAYGMENLTDVDGNPIAGSGKNLRSEVGGYIKMVYKTPVVENVDLVSKVDFFSNYFDRPENIDVNWENIITMKVNSFLSVSVAIQLLYDNDMLIVRSPAKIDDGGNVITPASIGPATQFKQTLALGVSYKF